MRVPISWLNEYVDVADLSAADLDGLLTAAGLEVTSVEPVGVDGAELVWDRDKVVWSRVLKVEQHPEADRLVLATVDYGASDPKMVVTGAPNLFEFLQNSELESRELFSPLVLEGGTYLDPYKEGPDGKAKPTRLKGKKLRGIYNDAMLCSPVELGLGEDHDGILLVDVADGGVSHAPGTPLQDVLGDTVLDIDIIPNIARCASIVGVAREVAALTGKPLVLPSFDVEMSGDSIDGKVVVRAEHLDLNPRFVAFLIEGVEQKPSPFWMQHRLRLAGQRPLHVVVDVSNYVMLELGQPNHTFDYDFLRRRADQYAPDGPIEIVTRLAEPDETLVTLDGTEHKLRSNNILVADPLGNLSVGGVMGGHESEIQDETTNVLLEAASWNFINIRQSARQLGLHTEAGFRFSRGVHPSQALLGARRAAELLRRLASGSVASGWVDHYPQPAESVTVSLDPAYVRRLSGLSLAAAEMQALLERLEFAVELTGDQLQVTVPDHRLDIEGPHDLVEEICRLYGYDRVPSTVLADALPPQRGNPALELEESVKDLLVEQGFREAISYRLTTPENEARAHLEPAHLESGDSDSARDGAYVVITNPSTRDRSALRHSVLASLLEIGASNTRFREQLEMFEIGGVYLPIDGEPLPEERTELALVMTGPRIDASWNQVREDAMDFFDLKGVIEGLLGSLRVEAKFEPCEHATFQPGRVARIVANGVELGFLGEVHPTIVERYDFRVEREQPVVGATFDFERLAAARPGRWTVDPVPAYPAISEDLALVVDRGLAAGELRAQLAKAGQPLLTAVELFDVYQGKGLEDDKKSLAYHLTFRSPNKTLKDKDVQKLRRKILATVERSCGATLRE